MGTNEEIATRIAKRDYELGKVLPPAPSIDFEPFNPNQPVSPIVSKPGEFTEHDSRYGHCGLCGRLGCHGGCFK